MDTDQFLMYLIGHAAARGDSAARFIRLLYEAWRHAASNLYGRRPIFRPCPFLAEFVPMIDVILLAGGVGFFIAALFYVGLCERL